MVNKLTKRHQIDMDVDGATVTGLAAAFQQVSEHIGTYLIYGTWLAVTA